MFYLSDYIIEYDEKVATTVSDEFPPRSLSLYIKVGTGCRVLGVSFRV